MGPDLSFESIVREYSTHIHHLSSVIYMFLNIQGWKFEISSIFSFKTSIWSWTFEVRVWFLHGVFPNQLQMLYIILAIPSRNFTLVTSRWLQMLLALKAPFNLRRNAKIYTRKKRKKFYSFFQQNTAFISGADTERKHRRTSQQSLTHTKAGLIVVFAATRAKEAVNAKRNVLSKEIFSFSVLFCPPNCSVAIFLSLSTRSHISAELREAKRRKKFWHDKSSSYWFIETERKFFARCKNKVATKK